MSDVSEDFAAGNSADTVGAIVRRICLYLCCDDSDSGALATHRSRLPKVSRGGSDGVIVVRTTVDLQTDVFHALGVSPVLTRIYNPVCAINCSHLTARKCHASARSTSAKPYRWNMLQTNAKRDALEYDTVRRVKHILL